MALSGDKIKSRFAGNAGGAAFFIFGVWMLKDMKDYRGDVGFDTGTEVPQLPVRPGTLGQKEKGDVVN